MIQKLKTYIFMAASALMLAIPAAIPAAIASADQVCGANTIGHQLSAGANGAASGNATGNCTDPTGVSDNSIANVGHKAVNIFSIVIGVIAIIMIIFGGFRYITSGG